MPSSTEQAPSRQVGARQVIFGASDGLNSTLAVLLGLTGAPGPFIVHTLLAAAAGSGLSMGVSEWLSADTDTGPIGGLVLGAATAVASALPVVPYLLMSRSSAPLVAGLVAVAVGLTVAVLRGRVTGRPVRGAAQTLGLLGLVAVVCAAIGAG